MLTPPEIINKARRFWPKSLRAHAGGECLFPCVIPLSPPNSRELMAEFQHVDQWARDLKMFAGKQELELEFKTMNHRQLGTQRLPSRIHIPAMGQLVSLLKKQPEWDLFVRNLELTRESNAQLDAWLANRAQVLEQYQEVWDKLLAVVGYFTHHPRPDKYVRELDIAGVDTKFIESHLGILNELLHEVIPGDDFPDQNTRHNRMQQFCARFHLKYDPPLIRFRWLDPVLARRTSGLHDISVPLASFAGLPAELTSTINRVFITENKINGLSFPASKESLVIFGLGYGIESLSVIPWLKRKAVHYWGDIDTHGFAILSRLRGILPQTESCLMDEATLLACRNLWGTEAETVRFVSDAESLHLDDQESRLYRNLIDQVYGENLRLEQERIPLPMLADYLAGAVSPDLNAS